MASIKLRSSQLKFRKQSSAAPLIQVGVGVLFSTLVFEITKSRFSPQITIWESLALTILFITRSSIWAGYILRKHETLKEKGTTGATLKGQPIDASEAHTRPLGHSKEKILAARYRNQTPNRFADRNREIAEPMRQTGESTTFENEFQQSDGTIHVSSFDSFVRTHKYRNRSSHTLRAVVVFFAFILPVSFFGQNQSSKKSTSSSNKTTAERTVLKVDEGPALKANRHIRKERRAPSPGTALNEDDPQSAELPLSGR